MPTVPSRRGMFFLEVSIVSDWSWGDVARYYEPELNEEEIEYLLMCETAYPFSDVRLTVRQLYSAIRARANGIERCDLCGMKVPFHRGCIN